MVFATHFEDTLKRKSPVRTKDGDGSDRKKLSENAGNTRHLKKRTRPARAKSESQKRHKRSVPSEAAIALSAQLKALSSQKNLQEALKVYWAESNNEIRDGHHACIVVDCCGRSGAVEEGEKIVDAMQKSGTRINVETNTALLKGYVHSGMMQKASELYREMDASKDLWDKPNVRTLNTLLRGCLWTAASGKKMADSRNEFSGGVVTSEQAWYSFKNRSLKKKGTATGISLDSSSYEYSVTLLCQALRCDDAASRICEMLETFQIKSAQTPNGERFSCADQSAVESLAASHLSLARAYALLGRNHEARQSAQSALDAACSDSPSLDTSEKDKADQSEPVFKKHSSEGGKRAWRPQDSTRSSQTGPDESRRSVSNSLFRAHRSSELQSECKIILEACKKGAPQMKPQDVAHSLATRLFYFSGGGTTDLSAARPTKTELSQKIDQQNEILQQINSLWLSFGLAEALKATNPDVRFPSTRASLNEYYCKNVLKEIGIKDQPAIAKDGFIDFSNVFTLLSETPVKENDQPRTETEKRPLNIELGAGFGEWIVLQARTNPSYDYVAVELRSDRVGQMFSKLMSNGGDASLQNLCCVGSECGSFLSSRVPNGSVRRIFVNHPEPPTQTFGSDFTSLTQIAKGGTEPAHMLTSETLLSAAHCLDEKTGQIVVVTDNRWYARLICFTLLKFMAKNPGLLRTCFLEGHSGIYQTEAFPHSSSNTDGIKKVILYEGQPGEAIGHTVPKSQDQGSSYFDRLWRSGAGTHAEKKKRFIIVMERTGKPEPKPKLPTTTAVERSDKQCKKEKRNRKKSEAKQNRRNERRLLKRNEEA